METRAKHPDRESKVGALPAPRPAKSGADKAGCTLVPMLSGGRGSDSRSAGTGGTPTVLWNVEARRYHVVVGKVLVPERATETVNLTPSLYRLEK